MRKLLTLLALIVTTQGAQAGPAVIWSSPYPLVLKPGITFQGSDSSTTCNAAAAGSIRYNAGTFEGCNGSAWSSLGSGGGGGSGTVTSVALALPAIFSVSGSPVTTSGTLTGTLATQTTNKVFAAPNGSTGTPTFRALAAADIPSLAYANQALSNLASTAVNDNIIPNADGIVSLGSSAKEFLAVYTEELVPSASNTLSVHTADSATGTAALNLYSGSATASGDTGSFTLGSGNNAGSGDTGNVDITSGASVAGASGRISFETGAAATTRGQIIFKDGTQGTAGNFWVSSDTNGGGFWADGTNLGWDQTGKTFSLGAPEAGPGAVPFAMTAQRNDTDASGESGTLFVQHRNFHTTNSGALDSAQMLESDGQADAGVSGSNTVGVVFQAYRNNGASDAGAMGFLVGAYGGAHQTGTDAAASTNILAGVLAQTEVFTGNATAVADFYGLGGNVTGGTITNLYGIYIEPSSGGTKHNWLSGDVTLGGSSFAAPSTTLLVQGDMTAAKSVTDSGVSAGIFNASSHTTADGSNTTIGINGVASATVDAGFTNDKEVGGMNFSVTRGDGTDQGTLDTMNGANALLFLNSDAAGVTNRAYGMSTTFFSTSGTLTNLYDFYSERVPSGSGVVTNHYGVYIKDDSTTPVINYLSGQTQVGGSSPSLNTGASLQLTASDKALLLNNIDDTAEGAIGSNGMMAYNTTHNTFRCYVNGAWADCGSGGGGGSPGGSSGQVQFNSAGSFGGDAGLTWDNSSKRLGIGTASPTNTLDVNGFTRLHGGNTEMDGDVVVNGASQDPFQVFYSGNVSEFFLGRSASVNDTFVFTYWPVAAPFAYGDIHIYGIANQLTINDNSQIGINTNAPTHSLSVNGDADFIGHVYDTSINTGVSSCGTSPTRAGGDMAGRVTVGSGGVATSCTVNFGVAYPNAPVCVVDDESTSLLLKPTASTTALTITAATPFGAGDKLVYHCIGY